MAQTKTLSLIEAIANTAIGWAVAALTTVLVLPLFGYDVSEADALGISLIFTAVSLVRGYFLRRFFNWLLCK